MKKVELREQGTYVLLMQLKGNKKICIGALGEHRFRSGWYAYIGSAFGPGGLAARLRHHCNSASRPRWHIDYLRRHAGIHEVWISVEPERFECRWAGLFRDLPEAGSPVPGFGSSDCSCDTHLFYFAGSPACVLYGQYSIKKMMSPDLNLLS